MNILVTTDTHFGYAGKEEGIERPLDFSERIMKHLQLNLTDDSVLLHLGDVCYDNDEMWHNALRTLPGKKWLVLGNHDKRTFNWYMEHGWDFVGDSISLQAFGMNILFSHMPMITDVSTMNEKSFVTYKYDINIHGHFHNFTLEKIKLHEMHLYNRLNKKHFLISLENLNFMPISLKRVIALFKAGKRHSVIGA